MSLFYEPRMKPLGNTFVNFHGGDTHEGTDTSVRRLAQASRRSRSFSGYIPFELSSNFYIPRSGAETSGSWDAVRDLDLRIASWSSESSCSTSHRGPTECDGLLEGSSCLSQSGPTMAGCEERVHVPSETRDVKNSFRRNSRAHENEGPPSVSRGRAEQERHSFRSSADSNVPLNLGTSVMIRNLPLQITQRTLMAECDTSGFAGLYDFAYMPCCFVTGKGKGFAFINLDTTRTATAFAQSWHGSRRFGVSHGEALLNVSAAAIQGLANNVAKWNVPRMRRIRNPNRRPFVREVAQQVMESFE